jgi:hypothetical protein
MWEPLYERRTKVRMESQQQLQLRIRHDAEERNNVLQGM